MRAVWLTKFGDPDVLVAGDAPDPVAGPGRALIDVAFVNVTFIETMFRASGFGPFSGELPMIPGNGVGGVVSAVGAQVDASLIGKRVVSNTGGSGAYAERAAVAASDVLEVPEGLALEDAVALMADGRTAMMLAEAAGLRAGERVLVEAAAGGVGTLLVQLARARGATVVAAAGGERKLQVARDAGADIAVDYGEPDWTDVVRAATGAVDIVFDGVGGPKARAAFELIDPGGRMLSFGLASGEWADVAEDVAADRGVQLVRGVRGSPEDMREVARAAMAEAAAGRLRPLIGQRFPLERAADAHAAIESRATVGRTLLTVD